MSSSTSTSGMDTRTNGDQWTVMLSTMYSVILILTGMAFPLYEALQHKWLNSHEIGIFLTYLYLVSTIFLIYLQVNIYHETKRVRKEKAADERTTAVVKSSDEQLPEVSIIYNNGSTPMPERKNQTTSKDSRDALRPRKLLAVAVPRPNSVAGTHQESPAESPPNQDHLNLPEESPRARMNSSGSRITSMDLSLPAPANTDWDNEEDEDLVYEQFVLMEQTATLTHEGASFYLRLGCLLFGIANLVFVSIQIHAYVISEPECNSKELIYPSCFELVFLLVQTFFVFKHTHVHVRRSKGLIRFGLQHVLATNLCIWLRVLTKEVVEAFEKQHHVDSEVHVDDTSTNGSAHDGEYSSNNSDSCSREFVNALSPYLFPFVLEYSLIVVAVMAGIFHGLNLRITTELFASLQRAVHCPKEIEVTHTGVHHHEAFFAKSHRGLYLGVILLSATIVSIIIFFYTIGSSKNSDDALQIFYSTDIIISLLLITALFMGFYQLRGLNVTFNRDNTIDNVLLMVSMSGLVLLQIFILIASMFTLTDEKYSDFNAITIALQITACVVTVFLGLTQTAFVMGGLQRCAPTKEDRDQKPGRGVVTYLVISNLALWIYKTFQVKELSMTNLEDVYGSIAWPIILNVSMPLLLFYHFHSSVCLADVWYSAYEMESGPKYRTL